MSSSSSRTTTFRFASGASSWEAGTMCTHRSSSAGSGVGSWAGAGVGGYPPTLRAAWAIRKPDDDFSGSHLPAVDDFNRLVAGPVLCRR